MRKFFGVIFLFMFDIISKTWLFSHYALFQPYAIIGPLSLYCCQNQGMAWSLGSQYPDAVLYCSAVLLLFFSYDAFKKPSWVHVLILAGGAGNIFDRIVYGGVRDFILLSLGSYHWPVFNFADIYLTIGGLAIAFDIVEASFLKKSNIQSSAKELTQ